MSEIFKFYWNRLQKYFVICCCIGFLFYFQCGPLSFCLFCPYLDLAMIVSTCFRRQVHLQRQTKGAFLKDGLPSLPRRLINRYCDRNYRQAAACRDVIMGPTGFNPGNFNLVRSQLISLKQTHFSLTHETKTVPASKNFVRVKMKIQSFDRSWKVLHFCFWVRRNVMYRLTANWTRTKSYVCRNIGTMTFSGICDRTLVLIDFDLK